MRRRLRLGSGGALATVVLVIFGVIAPSSATAAVTPAAEPAALLAAMSPPTYGLSNATATFVERPPQGTPTAVSDTLRAAFPSAGTYAVLSTGDATSADLSNSSPLTSADNGGGATRDGAERDVVVVRIDFATVAPNCILSFDYQFLSEEYPEFAGAGFGDSFVAELDVSTWSAIGGVVRAPNAFVFESVDRTPMTSAGATGSTYDGGKPARGIAAVNVGVAGRHSLYLSLFDVADNLYDTAVLIDDLTSC